MINKKKLWFMTLFSLILVLSIYYLTMPEELLLVNSNKDNNSDAEELKVDVEESDILVALRVESDKQMHEVMEDLQMVLTDVNASIEDKNKAIEDIKELNNRRGVEESFEEKINKALNLKSFVKIEDKNIRVIVSSEKHDSSIANEIMRLIQKEYKEHINVSVKFQTS